MKAHGNVFQQVIADERVAAGKVARRATRLRELRSSSSVMSGPSWSRMSCLCTAFAAASRVRAGVTPVGSNSSDAQFGEPRGDGSPCRGCGALRTPSAGFSRWPACAGAEGSRDG
jgi:hypothetical protein